MSINWLDAEVMPLAIGGAGMAYVQFDPTATLPTQVMVLAGSRQPQSVTDTGDGVVAQALHTPTSKGFTRGAFWGAPASASSYIQFYAFDGTSWSAAPPITGADLTPKYSVAFPWSADWVVDRLQEIAAVIPPFPNGKNLRITRAFPRDTHSWPAINVQVDALNSSGAFIQDSRGAANVIGQQATAYQKGRLYTLQLSVVGWCGTPEERSLLGQWMGSAFEVILDAAQALGWEDPNCNMRESEDFELLGVPTFLVNGTLSVSVQAALAASYRSNYYALDPLTTLNPSSTI